MGVLDEVRDLAEAVVSRRSLVLWDVEVTGVPGRRVVRVFVDSASGGVDLETVAEVSEEISRGLDLRDPIEGRYTLEVSSPGLERALRRPDHFAACIGRRVALRTTRVLAGNSHRIEGTLVAADEATVTVDTGAGEVEVPYADIRSARTVFEWGAGS